MSEMRTIEIDFDVHKMIEAERRSFSEPPNVALRRLLKLPTKATEPLSQERLSSGRGWTGKGVVLPHGTELRMTYGEQHFTGRIVDGVWAVEGKKFDTPSGAAGGLALTKDGKHPPLNGWIYWEVKRPGETGWTPINRLRRTSNVSLEDLDLDI